MSFDGANGGRLTVGQVASLAGCSADTVRAWERDGLLAARRTPGGQRRFDEEEVRRFLKLRHRAPQVSPPEQKQPSKGRSTPSPARPSLELPPETYIEPSPLEIELHEETLALEVLRKQKEREEVERREAELQQERERRAEAESARAQSAQRLEELKSRGDDRPGGLRDCSAPSGQPLGLRRSGVHSIPSRTASAAPPGPEG
jgi:excisionase family DNA binding protein